MTRLTETQSIILSAGAQRPGNIAMPLPKGLHGAAARMAIGRMIERGLLEEVDANISKGEPLWRETGDGHGTTLKVTNAGLAAIGIVPELPAQADLPEKTDADPVRPSLRAGTKQAQLIALLEAPEGVTIEAIIAATGWRSHSVRGFMSGTLGKKLGLNVTSTKEEGRARVYRISRRPT
ncbi:DUF3489 domain-containing protein [Cypionkella sp.]|uniref:DUF3489 domain-containing protein n=1 Tax=Cypionkella sp. TaxID=2811411 RepID=UPI00272474A2|nr:DUF3489 domain-containing protein [Cypionkella sp.]MDO8984496.1 DUF3489 domain-containing protein [Cypionkella sp.]MDP2049701.1 DUF3489 domain-containing protein [Cypionkella sp.]